MSTYYQRNKEKILAYQNEYNRQHRDKLLEYFKQYYIKVLKPIRTIPPELHKKRPKKEKPPRPPRPPKAPKPPKEPEYPKEHIVDPSLVIRHGIFTVSFN
jgi:hypothetical protein